MGSDLAGLGRTVELRTPRRRRRRLAPFLAVLVVAAAVGARLSDDADPATDVFATGDALPEAADQPDERAAGAAAPPVADLPPEGPVVQLPVLGRAGGLELRVPAVAPIAVSYHEASFVEALPIEPLGTLSQNENSTRPLVHEPHPDGIDFHVQVSRGRVNASTSAVDVLLPPDEQVRAPVSGTVTDVRPYQLYGRHDDVRIELRADDADLAVVLIHVRDVVVRRGDRVEVGDVLAGSARSFPFGAVVDRLTEPERFGHVHMEVKAPE